MTCLRPQVLLELKFAFLNILIQYHFGSKTVIAPCFIHVLLPLLIICEVHLLGGALDVRLLILQYHPKNVTATHRLSMQGIARILLALRVV